MIIKNLSPQGKFLHIKVAGYSTKKWLGSYAILDIPEITSKSQLNLNAHEEAMIAEVATTGEDFIKVDETFYYKLQATVGSTGSCSGTTSLSATTITVKEGLTTSFTIYPGSNCLISAYTLNNVSHLTDLSNVSASTTVTIANIKQDYKIYAAFKVFGT